MYQHFPFQGPPKYTQIGISGTKINHLATPARPFFRIVRNIPDSNEGYLVSEIKLESSLKMGATLTL
jgi:hypothetical protein